MKVCLTIKIGIISFHPTIYLFIYFVKKFIVIDALQGNFVHFIPISQQCVVFTYFRFQIPGRVWSLDKWRHHLATNHHQGAARQAWDNTESAVLHTLLLMEAGVRQYRSEHRLVSIQLQYRIPDLWLSG